MPSRNLNYGSEQFETQVCLSCIPETSRLLHYFFSPEPSPKATLSVSSPLKRFNNSKDNNISWFHSLKGPPFDLLQPTFYLKVNFYNWVLIASLVYEWSNITVLLSINYFHIDLGSNGNISHRVQIQHNVGDKRVLL